MTGLTRGFYSVLFFGVLILTVYGCAKPLTERDIMQQRIVRQLEAGKVEYTSLRLMNPPGLTNAPVKDLWIALNMTGMQRVISLEALKGLPLKILRLSDTNVHSLYPLAGMPLMILAVDGTKIRDLSPIEGMPLKTLLINNSRVVDVSPLHGLPLETLKFDPTHIVSGLEGLRDIETLKYINGTTAAQFWRKRDSGVTH